MFGSLKKKLKDSVKKLSREVAEPTPEQEEAFLHEKEESPQPQQEEDRLEMEKEQEEHFEEQELPDETKKTPEGLPEPELTPETLEERELPEEESLEEQELQKEQSLEKKGFLKRLKRLPASVTEKTLTSEDIDSFVSEIEADLLQSNVAVEVIDFFRENLKKELADKVIKRSSSDQTIRDAFTTTLTKVLNQDPVSLEDVIQKARGEKRPAVIVVLGFNGAGKTTTIAKLASHLKASGHSVVLAAADTYRAASLEQLDVHGKKLGVNVIKHDYGSDPAAVVFDAVKHATSKKIDVVIADTAGRVHVDKNLIDELKKIVRVGKPDFKLLVLDSLTGNDIVSQAQKFDEAVGVDGMILTKIDVNEKGGAVLSAAFVTKKPILFLGTGQNYQDFLPYRPEVLAKELME